MSTLQIGLQQIGILLLLMLAGYGAMKTGVMNKAMQAGIARLVLNIGIPAMIIVNVAGTFSAVNVGRVLTVLAFSAVYHLLFFFGLNAVVPRFFATREKATLAASSMTFANVMFIGVPVISNILGPDSLIYIVAGSIPFNFLLLTVVPLTLRRSVRADLAAEAGEAAVVADYGAPKGAAKAKLARVLLSPINVALVLTLLLVAFSMKLPAVIEAPLKELGAINTPLSMISIGSVLAERPLGDLFREKDYYIISLFRCLIIPLLVFGVLLLLPLDRYVAKVLFLLFAMPAASINAMVAEAAGADFEYTSMAITQTTILFFPALILMVRLLDFL